MPDATFLMGLPRTFSGTRDDLTDVRMRNDDRTFDGLRADHWLRQLCSHWRQNGIVLWGTIRPLAAAAVRCPLREPIADLAKFRHTLSNVLKPAEASARVSVSNKSTWSEDMMAGRLHQRLIETSEQFALACEGNEASTADAALFCGAQELAASGLRIKFLFRTNGARLTANSDAIRMYLRELVASFSVGVSSSPASHKVIE